ncbi:hypothetical protein [Candidatus Uabimicrobium amorphum]|uniref:Uncharacterized protein n=1 Tax=Uabimicrobium amorphum TaxID=2596890 RepID=A0A5S9F1A4_UABAM|nr:hypothetical protein [Candidatus Uabimicrobium amorphum]BBM82356.1 hypothetical protein UABAM_00699 [Candidatus Uabimicrobium amorphum]
MKHLITLFLVFIFFNEGKAQNSFPVYPQSQQIQEQSFPIPNFAQVTLINKEDCTQIYNWYNAQLKNKGWKIIQQQPTTGKQKRWGIVAKYEKVTATIRGNWQHRDKHSRFKISIIGPGIHQKIFSQVPQHKPKVVEKKPHNTTPANPQDEKEDLEDINKTLQKLFGKKIPFIDRLPKTEKEQREFEQLMDKMGEALDKGEKMDPKAISKVLQRLLGKKVPIPQLNPQDMQALTKTPPNKFQSAMTEFPHEVEPLLQALENFCLKSDSVSINRVLYQAMRCRHYNRRLDKEAKKWAKKNMGSAASVFAMSAQLDMSIGIAVTGVERIKENLELLSVVKPQICELVQQIRNKQMPLITATMKSTSQLIEVAKRKEQDGGPDTPIKKVILQKSRQHYQPKTTLTVTKHWTPTKEYWAQILPKTWIALRCWNMGCPDRCISQDYCLAFQDKEHCARTNGVRGKDNIENRMAALSDPMTLYGLTSLTVEVGDPQQLQQGGYVRFWINGDFLMDIALDQQTRPFVPAQNIQDLGKDGGVNIFDGFANNIEQTYGSDAAEYYKTSARYPRAVSESSGGEFNGYVLFVPVGVGGVDDDNASLVVIPYVGQVASLLKRIVSIARNNHPALERPHKVSIQAVVGGHQSQVHEFTIPSVFQQLSESAGTWDAWPGGDPQEWKFNAVLGSPPEPKCPAKMDIKKAANKMLEDSKKLAKAYQWLIYKYWLEKIRDLGIKKLMEKFTGGSLKSYQKLVNGTKGKYVGFQHYSKKGFNKLTDFIFENLDTTAAEWANQNIQDSIQQAATEQFDAKIGKKFWQEAEQRRRRYIITKDLTCRSLRISAIRRLQYHRWRIMVAGETALQLQEKWGDLDSIIGAPTSFIGTIGGPLAQKMMLPVTSFQYSGAATLLLSNLNAIREIDRHLNAINNILGYPHSYRWRE